MTAHEVGARHHIDQTAIRNAQAGLGPEGRLTSALMRYAVYHRQHICPRCGERIRRGNGLTRHGIDGCWCQKCERGEK